MTQPLQPASPTVKVFPDGRMDTTNAAAYVGVSPKSMAIMRSTGTGCPYHKIGKAVFYRKDDLDAWIQSRRTTSTSDYRAQRLAA